MKVGWKMFWFAGCVLWGVRASAAPVITTTPDLEYSQDGTTWEDFDVIVGRQKVKQYYNYYGLSGHPAFGTTRNVATAAFYWDAKRKALSMIIINGQARHGFRNAQGEAKYTFSNLTAATYISMRDDPDDIDYRKGTRSGTAHFKYKSSTDGVVFSGLEQKKLGVKVELDAVEDLNTWRLIDGSTSVVLDRNQPLFFRQAGVNSAPVPPTGGSGGGGSGTPGTGTPAVPEPGAAMGLAAAAAWGLFARRRRG